MILSHCIWIKVSVDHFCKKLFHRCLMFVTYLLCRCQTIKDTVVCLIRPQNLSLPKIKMKQNTLTQHVKNFIFLTSNQHICYFTRGLFSVYSWGINYRGRPIGKCNVVNFENSVISSYVIVINGNRQCLSLLLIEIRLSCLRVLSTSQVN